MVFYSVSFIVHNLCSLSFGMKESCSLQARAVIPHFFQESDNLVDEIGCGFGSRKKGSRLLRMNSLLRCLCGLLNLSHRSNDAVLSLRDAKPYLSCISKSRFPRHDVDIEVILVVNRKDYLAEVVDTLRPRVKVLQCTIDDPRELGLCARDWLISHPNPADVNLYLEDDLVIQDINYLDKILWFAERSDHTAVLLPHRFELTRNPAFPPRLFIDGPINHEEISSWHSPHPAAAEGSYANETSIMFDIPSNPHSGCFGISRSQLLVLRSRSLPRSGFVGPLETAATFTVGSAFKLFKPAMSHREFLMVEHSFPSFLGYLKGAEL